MLEAVQVGKNAILAPAGLFFAFELNGTQPNTAGTPTLREFSNVSLYPRKITKLMSMSNGYA